MIIRFWFAAALCLAMSLQWQGVAAQSGVTEQVVRVDPVARDGQLYIDADVEFEISNELRTAASKGVPIYFQAELEIVSSRWWWFDHVVADQTLTYRIAYNTLTRQWRVGTGDLSLPEQSLDDALSFVRNIRGWAVADLDDLDTDKEYRGRIRVRLDTSRLPRPFQIDAYNSSAWSLATPWKEFLFSISVDARQPS